MRHWSLVPILLLLPCAVAAQTDTTIAPEKRAAVRLLLEVAGTQSMILEGLEQGLPEATDGLPPGFMDELKAAARKRVPELTESLVPVYARELSLDEINQLITWFQSPVGKRFVEVQPTIMRESMLVAERWGVMLAGEVIAEMAKRGKPIR